MRIANPHPPRRGAFLLIALFSCLQILFGFFLFSGNGQDSVLPSRSSIQVASYYNGSMFNNIEPAAGYEPQINSLKRDCDSCGTFSFFDQYRKRSQTRAKAKTATKKHAALNKRMQQKRALRAGSSNHIQQERYNPVNRRIITNNTD